MLLLLLSDNLDCLGARAASAAAPARRMASMSRAASGHQHDLLDSLTDEQLEPADDGPAGGLPRRRQRRRPWVVEDVDEQTRAVRDRPACGDVGRDRADHDVSCERLGRRRPGAGSCLDPELSPPAPPGRTAASRDGGRAPPRRGRARAARAATAERAVAPAPTTVAVLEAPTPASTRIVLQTGDVGVEASAGRRPSSSTVFTARTAAARGSTSVEQAEHGLLQRHGERQTDPVRPQGVADEVGEVGGGDVDAVYVQSRPSSTVGRPVQHRRERVLDRVAEDGRPTRPGRAAYRWGTTASITAPGRRTRP